MTRKVKNYLKRIEIIGKYYKKWRKWGSYGKLKKKSSKFRLYSSCRLNKSFFKIFAPLFI